MKKLIPAPFDETNLSTEMIDTVLSDVTNCNFAVCGKKWIGFYKHHPFSVKVNRNKLEISTDLSLQNDLANCFVNEEMLSLSDIIAKVETTNDKKLTIVSYYYEIEEAE